MHVALVTGSDGPAFMREVDAPLVDALEARGATVATPSWRDPDVAWDGFDLAVVRTTWDYLDDRDGFVRWAEAVAAATPVWNPPDVLRWNTHKSYLLELEDRGAPIVPTAWLAHGDRVSLDALLDARGWDRAVVKPAVDAAASRLRRVGRHDDAGQDHLDELLATDDVLVQRYLPTIETRGELSVVVVDGEVTHAARKRPADGDFRVQEEYGGRSVRETVDRDVAALATWVVDATGADLLAARVDLLEDEVGGLQLVELEVTEPDLFLLDAPDAAARLAIAILDRSSTRPGPADVRSS
jgi:glutathione synthase/RimK-type ligase-like ATP-grasp enzyme